MNDFESENPDEELDQFPSSIPYDLKGQRTLEPISIGIQSLDELSHDQVDQTDGHAKNTVIYYCPVDHDGTTVYLKGWITDEPKGPPIVIVHDAGESISHYREAAKILVEQGHNVYGFDLRGHGRSGGSLGHVDSFDVFLRDLMQVLAWVKHKEGRSLPVVIAQGVGALVALNFQEKYPDRLRALVIVSPAFKLRRRPSFLIRLLIAILAEPFPRLRLPSQINPHISDPQATESITITESFSQRLSVRMSVQFVKEVLAAFQKISEKAPSIRCPTLCVVADHDYLFDQSVVHEYFKPFEGSRFTIETITSVQHNFMTGSRDGLMQVIDVSTEWIKHLE